MRTALVLPALLATVFAAPAFAREAASATPPTASATDTVLVGIVNSEARPAESKARDVYRHPVDSLSFWGLKPGMTILEIQPGAQAWWTEILAPYAKQTGGKYYATAPDLANPKLSEDARKARADFEARYADADRFGKIELVNWGAVSRTLPADTFDFILTARSIHGWMQQEPGTVEATFREFHKALKPGGVLAVEQHRANPLPAGGAEDPKSGYVTEAYVIDQAEKAGFKLAGRSEINANPKDTKDHPFGVWSLPPALRTTAYGPGQAADPAIDQSKYKAIGESDRMTLKFVK
jgi:predicted methyltransferase